MVSSPGPPRDDDGVDGRVGVRAAERRPRLSRAPDAVVVAATVAIDRGGVAVPVGRRGPDGQPARYNRLEQALQSADQNRRSGNTL